MAEFGERSAGTAVAAAGVVVGDAVIAVGMIDAAADDSGSTAALPLSLSPSNRLSPDSFSPNGLDFDAVVSACFRISDTSSGHFFFTRDWRSITLGRASLLLWTACGRDGGEGRSGSGGGSAGVAVVVVLVVGARLDETE